MRRVERGFAFVLLVLLLSPGTSGPPTPPSETCAGWPLPGKTTSFAGPGRWQHVGNHRVEVIVTEEHLLGAAALPRWCGARDRSLGAT